MLARCSTPTRSSSWSCRSHAGPSEPIQPRRGRQDQPGGLPAALSVGRALLALGGRADHPESGAGEGSLRPTLAAAFGPNAEQQQWRLLSAGTLGEAFGKMETAVRVYKSWG